jgi:hypothetical protein
MMTSQSLCFSRSSRTPDFILAEYIGGCLAAWNRATAERERWYGVHLSIGGIVTNVEAPYDGGRQDALWKEIGPDTGDAQPMLPLEVQSDD